MHCLRSTLLGSQSISVPLRFPRLPFHCPRCFSVLQLYINEIIQSAFFGVWLPSFKKHFVSSTVNRAAVCGVCMNVFEHVVHVRESAQAHVCARVWRPKIEVSCLPPSPSLPIGGRPSQSNPELTNMAAPGS